MRENVRHVDERHCTVFDNRVRNVATLTNRVLEVALGGLEAGADVGRLLVGRARRKLGCKLGLEWPENNSRCKAVL